MKNLSFALLVIILGFLCWDFYVGKVDPMEHTKLQQKVLEQSLQLESLKQSYVEQRVENRKFDDSVLFEIKTIRTLIQTDNLKITNEKSKLSNASDDSNIYYFLDFTNKWNQRSNTTK